MGRYILEAIGEHAKQRVGGANLLLWIDKPVLLGRAVKDTEGYKFPNHWNSLSSKHCKLVFQDVSESRREHTQHRYETGHALSHIHAQLKRAMHFHCCWHQVSVH